MATKEEENAVRKAIIQTGYTHIWQALGYREGELTLESDEGEELAFQMGLLLQGGVAEGYESNNEELLGSARRLIQWNSDDTTHGGP